MRTGDASRTDQGGVPPPQLLIYSTKKTKKVSGIHMLSARYRIHKKDPKIEGFSINFPLYCSDLNQGCNGGFPSLISMWSSHVGLVPKSCTGEYLNSHSVDLLILSQIRFSFSFKFNQFHYQFLIQFVNPC